MFDVAFVDNDRFVLAIMIFRNNPSCTQCYVLELVLIVYVEKANNLQLVVHFTSHQRDLCLQLIAFSSLTVTILTFYKDSLLRVENVMCSIKRSARAYLGTNPLNTITER